MVSGTKRLALPYTPITHAQLDKDLNENNRSYTGVHYISLFSQRNALKTILKKTPYLQFTIIFHNVINKNKKKHWFERLICLSLCSLKNNLRVRALFKTSAASKKHAIFYYCYGNIYSFTPPEYDTKSIDPFLSAEPV